MKEYSKEVYTNIESLSEAFNTKPYGFKEKIKWNGGEYLVFVRALVPNRIALFKTHTPEAVELLASSISTVPKLSMKPSSVPLVLAMRT